MLASTGDRLTPILYSPNNARCEQAGVDGFLNAYNVTPGNYYIIVDGMTDASYILSYDCMPSAFNTSTSIKEEKEQNVEILIYPNPSNGEVNVTFSSWNNDAITYQLFDITGKIVTEGSVKGKASKLNFNQGNIKNGVYFLNFISNEQMISKRIIIER